MKNNDEDAVAFLPTLRGYWHPETLTRWNRSELEMVDLPQICKDYLSEIGLPHLPNLTFRFGDKTRALIRLSQYERHFAGKPIGRDEFGKSLLGELLAHKLPTSARNLVIIGFDFVNPICVSPQGVVIYDLGAGTTTFVNSRAWALCVCLFHFDTCCKTARSKKPSKPATRAKDLRNRIRAVDPTAISGAENFWSTIVEEIKTD